jgi:hypothetical protein
MTIVVATPDTRTPERNYILGVILGEFLGLDWQRVPSDRTDTRITLQGHQGEIRMPDTLLQTLEEQWLTPQSLPSQPLPVWDSSELGLPITVVDKYLPIIYGNQTLSSISQSSTINYSPLTINLPIDIFGSAFFMLTRYEEIVNLDRDEHDRFPAHASLAFQEGFLDRPIIDEYVEVLWEAMNRLWPCLSRKERKFEMKVSHDVDAPSRYGFLTIPQTIRAMGGDILLRRKIGTALQGCWYQSKSKNGIHKSDPYNTFDVIMDMSERHNLVSAFYFKCGRTHPAYDAQYEIEHPAIRKLLRCIHDRGHECGLHPSYGAYQVPQTIVNEANRLRRVCDEEGIRQTEWGGRMHYLRWETPTTIYGWEQAGMTYDSTLSFADHAGFRCGTCHEYPAFDPVSRISFNLKIRPLIAMECTVMDEKYMGLGLTPSAYEKFVQLKQACRTVCGTFTLLWHNRRFTTHQECELYEAVVKA